MPKAKVGGYRYNRALSRAIRTNQAARRALSKILDERPGPERAALLLTEAALELSKNFEALIEIQEIGEDAHKRRMEKSSDDLVGDG